jgi:ubiquinone/menaquinone biosynthesis C-methylase UbiE
MARPLLLFCLAFGFLTAEAQKSNGLEKKLEVFWKAKHVRAKAIADAVSFNAGDVVADIGTADGWFAALLSVFTNNVTFYLEDVDSAVWNKERFDTALAHFASEQGTAPSNHYTYVKGTETSTGLPDNTFDKVLIIDTYHHFNNLDEMLNDVISLLRPEGELIILEALARRPGDFHQGCRSKIFLEEEIIARMATHGMNVRSAKLIHKVAGRKNKLFVFVKQ